MTCRDICWVIDKHHFEDVNDDRFCLIILYCKNICLLPVNRNGFWTLYAPLHRYSRCLLPGSQALTPVTEYDTSTILATKVLQRFFHSGFETDKSVV